MKHDAGALAEPYWYTAYRVLVEHYKLLEARLQERLSDLEEERKRTDALKESVQYYSKRYEALQMDYVARLRAPGMSEKDIQEFDAYWKDHTERMF